MDAGPSSLPRWRRFGLAAIAVAVAFAVRLSLSPYIGGLVPFSMFAFAVVVAAWYGGWAPAVAATAAGVVLGDYFFLWPRGSFGIQTIEDAAQLGTYLIVSLTAVVLIEALHRARRRAQEAVLRHEATNRRNVEILASITDCYCALDGQWRIVEINQQAVAYMAMRGEQLVGENLWERFPKLRGSVLEQQFRRAAAEQTPVHFETLSPQFGRWAEIHVHPSPQGVSVYWRDITDRKRGEEAVRQSEARFRRMADSNMIGIAFWDVDGKLTAANDAYLALIGHTRGEMQSGGLNWRDLTPPEFRDRDERAMAELHERGVCEPYEKQYMRKDGTRVPVLLGAALLDGSRQEGVAYAIDLTERKRAEEKIARSEASLAEAQRLAHVGSWERDVIGNRAVWSDEMYRIFGQDPATFVPTYESFLACVHPEDRPALDQAVATLRRTGGPFELAYRIIRPDGTVRATHGRGRVDPGHPGRPARIVGVIQDVTELKLIEQELRGVLTHARCILWHADVHAADDLPDDDLGPRPLLWQASVSDPAGAQQILPLDVLAGKTYCQALWRQSFPQDRARMRATSVQAILGGQHSYRQEFRCTDKDGHVHWLHEAVQIEPRGQGHWHVSGLMVDITERKLAEQALRQSETMYRTLGEAVPDFTWSAGVDGRADYVNQRWQQYTGLTLEQVQQTGWECVNHPEDLAALKSAWAQAAQRGEPFEGEFRYRRHDGIYRWFWGRAVPIKDSQQRVVRWVGTSIDIEERKRAESRLASYQQRLRSLATELSVAEERERRRIAARLHDDVGQILSLCQMKLESLRNLPPADRADGAEEVGRLLEQAIGRTRTLTCELSPPILYELGFAAALEWLAEQTQKQAGIPVDFDGDNAPESLDEEVRLFLFQAAREMLANVVKHARATRAVVRLRHAGDELTVTVEDDGIGFDASAPPGHEGNSFGLFNIRERVRHYGGRLDVASKPGRGAIFTLVAPAGGALVSLRTDGSE